MTVKDCKVKVHYYCCHWHCDYSLNYCCCSFGPLVRMALKAVMKNDRDLTELRPLYLIVGVFGLILRVLDLVLRIFECIVTICLGVYLVL